MIVDVAVLPSTVYDIERKIAIVVDALRASSSIIAMFESGAEAVIVAGSAREALDLAASERERYLVCGEVGGVPPAGFDYGNSPRQLSGVDLSGRMVVLSTSNGTRALHAVAAARQVLIGTGRNGPAVAEAALTAAERSRSDLTIVCAGDDGGRLVSLEDCFFAGYLVDVLARRRPFSWPVDEANPRPGDPACWVLDESAVIARRLFRSYLRGGADGVPAPADVLAMFGEARNGATLPRLGYAQDLEFCAEIDRTTVVPRLVNRAGQLMLVAGT